MSAPDRIRSIELFQVPPRWLFLKVTTDAGLVGWGEPIVEGRASTVKAAVEELAEYVVGFDATRIEDLWQTIYRGGFYRGGPILTSALSGIETALWDIRGKALGVPVYDMLGGAVRDKMRVYSWVGGDAPQDVADAAKAVVARGFTAIKMNGCDRMEWIDSRARVDKAVRTIAEVREAVGPSVMIGVDFHGRVHRGMAKVLAKELDAFGLMFIEEPVLSENLEALRDIVTHTSTPIATGERLYTRWDFKEVLKAGYVDIVQPDTCHAGGILETRKIAAMAEAFDVALAIHCPLGPIALAASLQVDFCTPNAFIQEQSLGIHYNVHSDLLDYLVDPGVFHYAAGFVARLTRPGLGIDIDEERVREAARIGHSWKNPVWRLEDGSVTEW
ncbi:galactonate dehydratase [Deinococcus yavapaiensis]|uniref:Galactonate dehydratase n=1 Tax=Deinococcus yavapaiensis KR-236 TaxID=694435 RepID=A0A318SSZ9_9DEIO|nr:galactonate dehydratase [Deinococcus yavapaiensis]PYE56336.1 galactonate dehydratase [Deinococcus yavapaiensis KR-236]